LDLSPERKAIIANVKKDKNQFIASQIAALKSTL
jgi:hypothetical protein